MEIRLDVSPETEATVEKDTDGNVRSIIFKPFFTSRKARAVIAYGKVKSDTGVELERFAIGVDGGEGTVDKKTFNRLKAAADETPEEKLQNEKNKPAEEKPAEAAAPAPVEETQTTKRTPRS